MKTLPQWPWDWNCFHAWKNSLPPVSLFNWAPTFTAGDMISMPVNRKWWEIWKPKVYSKGYTVTSITTSSGSSNIV